MSHFCDVSVLYCGRFQYGELLTLSIVEPQAPRFVTAYLPGYLVSSMICSCPG